MHFFVDEMHFFIIFLTAAQPMKADFSYRKANRPRLWSVTDF